MEEIMVLYHAISTYQLLEMIIYRLKNSNKKESILMITDTLRDKYPNVEGFKEFFNDVWVYSIDIPDMDNAYFQDKINDFFNNFFSEKNMGISEFDELNIGCAHYFLGHYLIGNKIRFNFFEDAAGILSRPDILINIEKDTRSFKCQKNMERGLYDGRNSLVDKVVCNKISQEEGILEWYKNVEDFNVIKELIEIDDDNKTKNKVSSKPVSAVTEEKDYKVSHVDEEESYADLLAYLNQYDREVLDIENFYGYEQMSCFDEHKSKAK
jgi:hypothetical protein